MPQENHAQHEPQLRAEGATQEEEVAPSKNRKVRKVYILLADRSNIYLAMKEI